MKLLQEKLPYKNINTLILNEIDMDNSRHLNVIINILKLLSEGDRYYFELTNADTFFCPDNLIEHYKNYLPEFLQKNGQYVVKNTKDDTRFQSIARLAINDRTLIEFEHIWRYYDGVLVFNPNALFTWDQFNCECFKLKPNFYGIGYINNELANMTFVKGHDGDNFIITYNTDKFDTEKIRRSIEQIINL